MVILNLEHQYQLNSLLCCIVLMSQAVHTHKNEITNDKYFHTSCIPTKTRARFALNFDYNFCYK